MSEANHRPARPDVLDQATEALRAAPVPAGPPAELAAATVAAVANRLPAAVPSELARRQRRRRVMRSIGYGAAAAAVVATLAGVLWFGGGTAVALDDAIRKVEKAEAVRYEVHTRSPLSDNTDTVTVRGKQVRVDSHSFARIAFVIDHQAQGMLIVSPPNKTYQTVDLSKATIAPFDAFSVRFRDQLLALLKKAEHAAVGEVNGAKADKFTASGRGLGMIQDADWVIWIDRKSQLPVRVEVEQTQQGRTVKRIYEKFDWNPEIDDDLFSLDPPDGYTEGTVFHTNPPLEPMKKKN